MRTANEHVVCLGVPVTLTIECDDGYTKRTLPQWVTGPGCASDHELVPTLEIHTHVYYVLLEDIQPQHRVTVRILPSRTLASSGFLVFGFAEARVIPNILFGFVWCRQTERLYLPCR